ncbi:hypothetical protein Fmac_032613 [Flemingia macrophylla]|uniref:Uncharacterized protein n=1 Tax=Flemingia macrophylla TaxID=520843 RepID=A0ABD1L5E9_9FABA
MECTPFVIKSTPMVMPQNDHKPQPLVIHVNKEKGPVAPLRILAPRSFLYESDKAIPWRCEVHMFINEDISNVARIGGQNCQGRALVIQRQTLLRRRELRPFSNTTMASTRSSREGFLYEKDQGQDWKVSTMIFESDLQEGRNPNVMVKGRHQVFSTCF